MSMRRTRPGQISPSSSAALLSEVDSSITESADSSRATKRAHKPQYNGAVTTLRALAAVFIILIILAIGHGDAGRVGSAALKAIGWKRKDRVALLTVATHMNRMAETSDSESEYGASKTAFSYPFSIDNKARYCELHQYDLNVDVHTDDSWEEMEEEEVKMSNNDQIKRSSRFRKLKLIKSLWNSYDWLIWMDIDALFIDPSTDVLSLLDETADIHFTLEEGGNGINRVNTGFFAIKTSEFAFDFFERAWAVNDCGRGQSDQRSINYVLGIVNHDDVYCQQNEAKMVWEKLFQKHFQSASTSLTDSSNPIPKPGDQDSRIRFYKKPLLNSFPKDVSNYLIPVELYSLPNKQGDERGASLIVHFAGQYGGARSIDGKMPIGMLVQYLHLLARYHSIFLDRLAAAQLKESIRRGEHGNHQFHDDSKHQKNNMKRTSPSIKDSTQHSQKGRHQPGSSPLSFSGYEDIGPKTLQDSVIDHAHEWTRGLTDIQSRLTKFEEMLETKCLSLMRKYYEPIVDSGTGIAYYEPPKLKIPELGTVNERQYNKYVDAYGKPRLDLEKTCDYSSVLSAARGHLAQFLPEIPYGTAVRWPRSLLCAAPMSPNDLETRLNTSRLWLETRKSSTMSKLKYGAPYFEDDEYSLGGGVRWEGDVTPLHDAEVLENIASKSGSFLGLFQGGAEERHSNHHHAIPLGPSLYTTIDVSSPLKTLSTNLVSHHESEQGRDDQAEEESEGEEEESEVETPNQGELLVAVSECAFLEPSTSTILEKTFAFTANPEKQRAAPSAFYAFDRTKLDMIKESASSSSSFSLLSSYPGAVVLPPIPRKGLHVIEHVTNFISKKKSAEETHNEDKEEDDNDDDDDENKPERKVAQLVFWTYTAPLLMKLTNELSNHIKIIIPKFDNPYDENEFKNGIELLKIPLHRLILLSSHHLIIYADILLSLHSQLSLDTISFNQLFTLRKPLISISLTSSATYDPYDDLIILIIEKPLDAKNGHGTKVSNWFTVEQSLREALPEERVVRFDHSFAPQDYSSLEFFKRAKMIVVSAGVVPSLLMTMYSSAEIPVLELVGKNSLNGDEKVKNNLGGHEGWDWTKQVCNGFRLNRLTIKSIRSDSKGNALFDSKVIAEVARKALFNHNVEEEEEVDDKENLFRNDDDGSNQQRDDLRTEQNNDKEQIDPNMPSDVYQLVHKFENEYHRQLVAKSSSSTVQKKKNLSVELGLHDRDRFGELFQRLDNEKENHNDHNFGLFGGAGVGVEFGDFSLQVLRRWPSCPKYIIYDSFISTPTMVLGDDNEKEEEPIKSSLSDYSSDVRYIKLKQVLKSYYKESKDSKVALASSKDIDRYYNFIYLDENDHSYENTKSKLNEYWARLRVGGILSGHDFTKAHEGTPKAVIEFALQNDLTLYLTDVMRPRSDVLGNTLPPCCPSWYFFKPPSSSSSLTNGGDDDRSVEIAAKLIINEMNEESFNNEEEEDSSSEEED